MENCKICKSYAINLNQNGRGETDPDLCDVCYWKKKCEELREGNEQLKVIIKQRDEHISMTNEDMSNLNAILKIYEDAFGSLKHAQKQLDELLNKE